MNSKFSADTLRAIISGKVDLTEIREYGFRVTILKFTKRGCQTGVKLRFDLISADGKVVKTLHESEELFELQTLTLATVQRAFEVSLS